MLTILNAAGKYRVIHNIIPKLFFFWNSQTALNALKYAKATSTAGIQTICTGNKIDTRGFSSENPMFKAKTVVIASEIPA